MLYKDYVNNRREYQELGHILLLEQKHACLFYKPGKGKTYPCIDALRDLQAERRSRGKDCKTLILSTADAVKNMWNVEILPQEILPEETVIMSFTAAIQENTKKKLLQVPWYCLIIDESHKIKSHNSQISKLVYRLSKKIEYVWGLTGTPRGNNDIDIFCQFHNMCIGDWGDISYTMFVDRCCDIDRKFFGGMMVKVPIGVNQMYRKGWEENIARYTQRIDYDEDDEMPDLKVNEVKIPYIPTKEYLQAEQGVISISEYESTMTKLSAIQKLHQAVNGFLYYPGDTEGKKGVHVITEVPDKLKILSMMIVEPTVIVYRFQYDKESIMNYIGGQWSITEDVEEFKNGEYSILLIQCSRCESFNLQMCKHIIFYTLDYSYIKYNQMVHRVWRLGQTENVKIDVLLYDKTVETKIWSAVQHKEALADLFMSIKGDEK